MAVALVQVVINHQPVERCLLLVLQQEGAAILPHQAVAILAHQVAVVQEQTPATLVAAVQVQGETNHHLQLDHI